VSERNLVTRAPADSYGFLLQAHTKTPSPVRGVRRFRATGPFAYHPSASDSQQEIRAEQQMLPNIDALCFAKQELKDGEQCD
jgi:hypothetical protein